MWPATSSSGVLVPHRALYELSQHRGTFESSIDGVSGQLELRFEASCDGWRLEQFLGFRLHFQGLDPNPHLSHLSAWETGDGLEFWFTTKSYQGSELTEEIGGVARMSDAHGDGEAQFTRPTEHTRALPRGTLFPIRHVEALIDAALAGEQHLRRIVFDGTSEDSPYEISAFIAPPASSDEAALGPLRGKRSWPLRLAYYRAGTVDPQPDFEMSVLLYANGVAGDMVYDYGDFAMDVKLQELEMLPVPQCSE